jgi:molecular chaperone HscB
MATEPTTRSAEAAATAGGARACWNCGRKDAGHFCAACGKVQPAGATDHFSFFALPRKLKLDLKRLERDFYALSRKLHPDVYARASAQEQEWSLEKSSQLNDAYRTLRDPIRRTEYLLQLEGVQLEEQSKAATEKARESGQMKQQMVPPDLLEEVFELNLQLEEARANKQMGEQDEQLAAELRAHKQNFEQKLEALGAELEQHWDEWDALIERGAEGEERALVRDKMVDLLNRRNYVRNLVRDVNEVIG